MSGPYENASMMDELCRIVMQEKETAACCLLFIVYEEKLVEVITGFKDQGSDLPAVLDCLRQAAAQVEALIAKEKPPA